MTLYDTRNSELIWRGLTLSGFAAEKINVTQDATPSSILYIGISGESMSCPNPKRRWVISSTFLADSLSYKILEQDNLNHVEDTLIVRDLNLGEVDIFTNCTIITIGTKKDGEYPTVRWQAPNRNYK